VKPRAILDVTTCTTHVKFHANILNAQADGIGVHKIPIFHIRLSEHKPKQSLFETLSVL